MAARASHRESALAYGRGLRALFRRQATPEAIAAACDVAEVLELLRQVLTKKE